MKLAAVHEAKLKYNAERKSKQEADKLNFERRKEKIEMEHGEARNARIEHFKVKHHNRHEARKHDMEEKWERKIEKLEQEKADIMSSQCDSVRVSDNPEQSEYELEVRSLESVKEKYTEAYKASISNMELEYQHKLRKLDDKCKDMELKKQLEKFQLEEQQYFERLMQRRNGQPVSENTENLTG